MYVNGKITSLSLNGEGRTVTERLRAFEAALEAELKRAEEQGVKSICVKIGSRVGYSSTTLVATITGEI